MNNTPHLSFAIGHVPIPPTEEPEPDILSAVANVATPEVETTVDNKTKKTSKEK